MAETPKHDLEKLLSDYARQRRDDAGTPEMHPATRRMLQAEVKQHCGTASSAEVPVQGVWWKQLWPRIAIACGILAALGVAVVLTVSPGNKSADEFTLAKTTGPTSASESLEAAATPPATAPARRGVAMKSAEPAVPPSVAPIFAETSRPDSVRSFSGAETRSASTVASKMADRSGSGATGIDAVTDSTRADGSKRETGLTLPKAPVAENSLALMPKGSPADLPIEAGSRERLKTAPAKSLGTPPIMALAKDGDLADKELEARQEARVGGELQVNTTQMFRNVVLEEKPKEAAKPAVLDEFTVEQNGSALKVIDRDGSVYNGYARPAPPATGDGYLAGGAAVQEPQAIGGVAGQSQEKNAPTQPTPTQVPFAASQNVGQAVQFQNAAAAQNYFFRVEGTNRSLNQRVVFTGNMIQNTLANTAQNQAAAQNFKQQAVQQNLNNGAVFNLQMQNNFINGRVQLGESKASTELNALSVDH